jgi:RNA polymerase sigma-70 factor (family 1)
VKLSKHVPESTDSTVSDTEKHLFEQLFKQHASGIYRLANAQLRSRVEAQEIVQESFLKFWEKRHEVSPDPLAIKGYLYTSAYNAVLKQVRRQQRWVLQDCTEDLMMEPAPQVAELEYQELTAHYTDALAQLPTKRREIFTLSRQRGLSNASIAEELNISIKTVEAQITQALKFIRQYFVLRGVLPALVMLLVEAFSG